MCAIAGLSNWFGIAITYLRYYKGVKAQGVDRKKMPFASRLNPYAAWWAAIACPTICLVIITIIIIKKIFDTPIYISNYRLTTVFLMTVLRIRRLSERTLGD